MKTKETYKSYVFTIEYDPVLKLWIANYDPVSNITASGKDKQEAINKMKVLLDAQEASDDEAT